MKNIVKTFLMTELARGMLVTWKRMFGPKITVQYVDYIDDPGAAIEVRNKYSLGMGTNLVIFACEGKPPQIVKGDALMTKQLEQQESERPNELVYEIQLSGGSDKRERQPRQHEAHRHVRAPPTQFLEQDREIDAAQPQPAGSGWYECAVPMLLIGLPQHRPERRAVRDHLLGASQAIQCLRRWAHALVGETARAGFQRLLLPRDVLVAIPPMGSHAARRPPTLAMNKPSLGDPIARDLSEVKKRGTGRRCSVCRVPPHRHE